MKKIICVTGPTGTGKTNYALQKAKEYNCSIINMDSVQIYQGMDIGSNKIQTEEMDGIKHYLLSYVNPLDNHTVASFQRDARNQISESLKNNDTVILVGGSGLYFNAVLFEYNFADYDNVQFDYLSGLKNEELIDELKRIDPKYELIDLKNPIRVLNAIKYYLANGKSISDNKNLNLFSPFKDYEIINYYIDILDDEILLEKIKNRTREMLKKGLISEVVGLIKNGVDSTLKSQQSIGYKQVHQYLNSEEQNIKFLSEEINLRTYQYVKKQRKWFRIKFNPKVNTIMVNVKENHEK
jgi:tRNA dimethylallyltransferase